MLLQKVLTHQDLLNLAAILTVWKFASQLQNNFKLLVGEAPQKNWVLWASQFNYWIQGHDPLLATVISVILMQHFPGILCATKF